MSGFANDEIRLARKMRRYGSDWNAIARAIGRRRRLDPEFWLRRNAYSASHMAAKKVFDAIEKMVTHV
jgi:hypothetical protein